MSGQTCLSSGNYLPVISFGTHPANYPTGPRVATTVHQHRPQATTLPLEPGCWTIKNLRVQTEVRAARLAYTTVAATTTTTFTMPTLWHLPILILLLPFASTTQETQWHCSEDASRRQKDLFVKHGVMQSTQCGTIGWYNWLLGGCTLISMDLRGRELPQPPRTQIRLCMLLVSVLHTAVTRHSDSPVWHWVMCITMSPSPLQSPFRGAA